MLAMLVPAAMAAPEWVHGVKITAPTAAAPTYVNPAKPVADPTKPDVQGDAAFTVNYDLTIVGTQVNPIDVRFRVFDANGWTVVWEWQGLIAPAKVHTGVNAMTSDLIYPDWGQGWFDLEVCAASAQGEWFCDTQKLAVVIDWTNPWVTLDNPASGAWVSGQAYQLIGSAGDDFDPGPRGSGIAKTWFDYCAWNNWNGWQCGNNDYWVPIAAGKASGLDDQYVGDPLWDTTQVPDGPGVVRFCAVDKVGLQACDWHQINVVNRYTVNLRPGWNLISTPLMLYDDDMDSVLAHLVAHGTVKDIYTAKNENAGEPDVYTWSKWIPGDKTTFNHGQGYWINMKASDSLTFVGAWKTTGPVTPPEYQVYEGWNLIGYTHWGQPTWLGDKVVADYLGMPLAPSVEALWRYDAWSEDYIPVGLMDSMTKGAGYWLATGDGGSINP